MNAVRHVLSVAGVLILLGLAGDVAAQNSTPPGYLNRVRQYRSGSAGANVNEGVPRSTSTFWSLDNTNGTVVVVTKTATISTNAVTPVEVPMSSNVIFSATTTEDMPVRSMTVTVAFDAERPLTGFIFTLMKDSVSEVIFQATHGTTGWDFAPGHTATLTFSPLSYEDPNNSTALQTFVANVTSTVMTPKGSAAFASFTNSTTKGTWQLKVASDSTVGGRYFAFRSLTINVVSDATSIAGPGKAPKDLTPRGVSERNPARFDSSGTLIHPLSRSDSER